MTPNTDAFILDSEEAWYEEHADSFEQASSTLRDELIKAAKNTAVKSERMNIRMSKRDMEGLKQAAAREGIPYQSLVSSILHKYTTGLLVDIGEARKLLAIDNH